jgi:ankyrin repeat protein
MRWLVIALPLLALVAASISIALQWRQENLDHRLIQAIKRRQNNLAISLLNAGASANAQDTPYSPLTIRTLVSTVWRILNRRGPSKLEYPSSLILTCTVGSDVHTVQSGAAPANAPLMRTLLSHGANPNVVHQGLNVTALDIEVMKGDCEVVKLMLEHGCQPNLSITPGQSPLGLALTYSRINVGKLLIGHGANINARVVNGSTVLHWAASGCDGVTWIDLLLSNGADINAQDVGGLTPLMEAVYFGPVNVRLLLQHGADTSIRDTYGHTALDLLNRIQSPDASDKRAIMHLLTESEAATVKRSHR